MELNIIKQIKALKQMLRHKPMLIVAEPKAETVIKVSKRNKPVAKKRTIVIIEGKELTLSQIAKIYNLELATVRARYRVGNRGKLLIRPVTNKWNSA